MDSREKLRKECHEDIAELRMDTSQPLPERAFRLLEKLVARLDRLETGSFSPEEIPTAPDSGQGRTRSSSSWSNQRVLEALKPKGEKGEKGGTGEGEE